MIRKTLLSLAAVGFAAPALAADLPKVRVADLDPSVLPEQLAWDDVRQRLVVDGQLVKGSRADQLEWLGQVLADETGAPPASLQLEERTRALKRQNVGLAVGIVASGAVAVVVIPAAVVALPIAAAAATTEVVAVSGALRSHRRFDGEGLAREVELQHGLLDDLRDATSDAAP